MSKKRAQGWGSRQAQQERQQHAALGRTREWQRAQQAVFRRMWRQQIAGLTQQDDAAYAVLRTPTDASELGVARPMTEQHAVAPAMLRYLERRADAVPPAQPINQSIIRALGPCALADPYRLARARLAFAQAQPDDSLIFEVLGWSGAGAGTIGFSENDLARAFHEQPGDLWSQPSISRRKYAACTWLRDQLSPRQEWPRDEVAS